MPRLPAALSVTASTMATSAFLPLVMNCFTPLSTQWSPSRCALRAQSRGFRPDMRLGEAERAEHVAARQRHQIALLLVLVRPRHQDRADRAVVDADDGRRRAVARGDLLECHCQRRVVHAGAAVLLGHGNAERAERRQFLQRLPWKGRVAIPLRGERSESLRREVAQRVAQLQVLFSEHRWSSRESVSDHPVPGLASEGDPRRAVGAAPAPR